MPTVTAMSQQVRRPGRVSIEIDDRYWQGASLEAIAEIGLRVGQSLTAEELDETARRLAGRAAFESALRILAARARTAAEIAARLSRKGLEDDQVDEVIERCRSLSLIDDEAVVRSRAESLAARGAGRARAQTELARLGLGKDELSLVLDEVFPAEGAAERAAAALERRYRPERLPDAASRQRALAWLLRQGHGMDDARAAIAALPAPVDPVVTDDEREAGGLDDQELVAQLRRRYPGAHRDRKVQQRAWGWAGRRGVRFDRFRAALAALAEDEG